MKILWLAILLGIVLVAGWVAFFVWEPTKQATVVELKQHISSDYDISFKYPNTYFLEEKEVGNAERGHYVFILTEDTEENKNLREGKEGIPREGSLAMTIDIYQNNLDQLTTDLWIASTSDSNYKLSIDGAISTTSVGGLTAKRYRWSGLYEGKSVVIATPLFVYMFSVTSITREDVILQDFERVLASVKFE